MSDDESISLYSTTEKPRIQELAFEGVMPLWKELWPDRQIRAMSSMLFDGGIDMEIYKHYRARYWGVFLGEALAGVNSGHRSSESDYRSRGLFVRAPFRGRGLAQILLNAAEAEARREGCARLWSYPRLASAEAYRRFGFQLTERVLHASDQNRYAFKFL